jgi:small conductance mechanosensitive channel
MTGVMAEIERQVIAFLPNLIMGAVIFAVFLAAAWVLRRVVASLASRTELGKRDVVLLLAQSVQIGLIVFGAITALGTIGIDISALVAGLGLTGFALGFALRDALSNILAGVLIILYRPFQRGDRIVVTGLDGTVTDIDLRYTTLLTEDRRILIPNSTLFTNAISVIRRDIPTGAGPGTG